MLLQELAKIATPTLAAGSLEEQYYRMLKRNANEQEVLETLFEGRSSPKNSLHQTRSSLKRKMIADIAIKSSKTGNAFLDAATEAYHLFSSGKILLARQMQNAGIELLEKCFKISDQLNLLSLALESAKSLASYYSSLSGNYKKFSFFQDAVKRLLQQLYVETQAQCFYDEISYHYTHKWNSNISSKAENYCKIIAPNINSSIKTAWFHYSIKCLAQISKLDFHGLVDVAQEAIDHFSKLPAQPRFTITAFQLKKATGCIKIKHFDTALHAVETVILINKDSIYSYCQANFYKALIGLHTQNISLCHDAIDCTENYWEDLPELFQEQWKIVQSYVALFSSRKFKIGKFLNEVPIFSKDKSGANAAILIVQMLHLIKDGRTNEYIDRCEALERYTVRNLNGQSKILAKLLLEVEKGHFNSNTIQFRTRRLVKMLTKQDRELSVMPAKNVWNLVMEWLK